MARAADVLRAAWRTSPLEVILPVVALAVVVGGLGLLAVTLLGLDQRSRSSVEAEAAEITSAYFRVPITATCSEPEDDQWRCVLRAADGRRGWLSQDVRYEGDPGFRRSRPRDDVTSAEFPVIGADGRQVETLEITPGSTVGTAAALRSWAGAWSVEPSAGSVIRNQLRCPEPDGDTVTPCPARGDVVAASVRRVGPTTVEMVVLWR
ncbi:hypothetical protein WCD74_10950 [Actinomycetospora sp. OC33-EN08]|uniref:DUF4333 domain-containing protein n=1 Tax=Actinomycetospora aurantiaca TaxID=3129233 RepID=A0ABU8MMB4_9PSEU